MWLYDILNLYYKEYALHISLKIYSFSLSALVFLHDHPFLIILTFLDRINTQC